MSNATWDRSAGVLQDPTQLSPAPGAHEVPLRKLAPSCGRPWAAGARPGKGSPEGPRLAPGPLSQSALSSKFSLGWLETPLNEMGLSALHLLP